MGLRQRLSLAVAVLHEPQILILDEPTSGVDPVARDSFWELLIDLSREQGVTIFVTTHFMNEGMRCDRISLMNAGKVLACDAPQKLIEQRGAANLEDAFIGYMEDVDRRRRRAQAAHGEAPAGAAPQPATHREAGAPAAARRRSRPACSCALGRMLRLRAQRDHADPPRSGAPGVRVRRLGAADAGLRLRDHHRRRAHPLRRARPRPVAREPRVPRAVRGLAALLHDDAAGALGRRGAAAAAVGRRLGGDRDPARLRARLPARRQPRGAGAGRRRHDRSAATPSRNTSQGVHSDRCSRTPRSGCRPRAPRSTRPTSRSASSTTRRSRASTRSCRASRRCCCC